MNRLITWLKKLCFHPKWEIIDRGKAGYAGQDWQYVFVEQCLLCGRIWKRYEWQPHPSIRFYDESLDKGEVWR